MSSIDELLATLKEHLAQARSDSTLTRLNKSEKDFASPVLAVISKWKKPPHYQAHLIAKIKKRLDADPSIDLDACNSDGESALHVLVSRRLNATARFLIEQGADPLLPDSDGKTPLTIAAMGTAGEEGVGTTMFLAWALDHVRKSGDDGARAVDRLLNEHMIADGYSDTAESPSLTEVAVMMPHDTEGLLRMLLDCGASPHGKTGAKRTLLHLAINSNNTAAATLLMDHGANVNALSSIDGATPLHIAVIKENMPAVMLLLRRGADPSMRMASSVGLGNPGWCNKDAADLADMDANHILADTLRTWSPTVVSP
jgi:ankyrin repeat protein